MKIIVEKEMLEQALEALELRRNQGVSITYNTMAEASISTLRTVIATAEKAEPVGEVDGFGLIWWRDRPPQGTKLYAAPVASSEDVKDAERYRYFKQCFDHPTERRELALRLGCKADEFDPDLDAAIDAAMEGEKR